MIYKAKVRYTAKFAEGRDAEITRAVVRDIINQMPIELVKKIFNIEKIDTGEEDVRVITPMFGDYREILKEQELVQYSGYIDADK